MLREVEPLNLVLGAYPQADGRVNDLENDGRADDCKSPCNPNSHQLIEDLMEVALNHSRGEGIPIRVLKDRVDHARGEYASQDRAQSPTGPVHAKGVK